MGRLIVLDASALLADIKDEPGAETVRDLMNAAADGLFMHAVNASEVAYHLIRFGLPPALAFRLAAPQGVVIVEDLERRLWERSAVLKAQYRNLALGDCVAISLAESLGAELLTGDRLFKQVETFVQIQSFR
ncbi:MAG: PIN domain-containing protein [Planctomycetaceae bacterium]|nr:PIN domain-containing protein [Planctomycetaceae bacterium]